MHLGSISYIQESLVLSERQTVRLREVASEHRQLTCPSVDFVDRREVQFEFSRYTGVIGSAERWIREEDIAVAPNDDIVRAIELFAIPVAREHFDRTVVLLSHDPTRTVLTRQNATFFVVRVTVGQIARFAIDRYASCF